MVSDTGSTGRIATEIASKIIQHDGECRIAYGRGETHGDYDTFKIETKAECAFHALMTRLTDRQGLFSTKATKRLISDIKKYKPDVIQLHNIHGYYLNYKSLFDFLKEYNRPIVWTLHDCWAFTGHCAHFTAAGCYKWKTQCKNCIQKREYPATWWKDSSEFNFQLKRKVFTGLDNLQIVTVSEWLKKEVEESFLGRYPIKTIYNGIKLKEFAISDNARLREKYGLEHKKVILGVASVWNDKKGSEIFKKLSQILPSTCKIVLIGIEKKRKKQFPSEILCIEKLAYSELIPWYSMADIYVNGSIEETMGLTTVEAMACGTPVIVQDTTALPEVVDENCGIIVKRGDVNAIAEGIMKIEKTDEISEKCKQCAKKFDSEKQYEEYYKVYNMLM